MGFPLNKGALEQILLQVHLVSPLSIIPPVLHVNSFISHQLRAQLNNTHNRTVVAIQLQWRSEVICSEAIRLRGWGHLVLGGAMSIAC
jgi:hypothetical protein